jgi:hypothetical protein
MYSYVCCGTQSFSGSKDRRYSSHLYTTLEQTSAQLFKMIATKASVHVANHCNVTKSNITVNPAKSTQITFTTRRTICPQVSINNFPIPIKQEVKYLRLHLDKKN